MTSDHPYEGTLIGDLSERQCQPILEWAADPASIRLLKRMDVEVAEVLPTPIAVVVSARKSRAGRIASTICSSTD